MIVLGADMHKRSHTITGVAAATGEMLGDKPVSVGVRGFDQVLQWARALGVERVWSLEARVRSAGGRCNASSGLVARVSGRKRPDARLGLWTGVKVRTPPVTVRGLTP